MRELKTSSTAILNYTLKLNNNLIFNTVEPHYNGHLGPNLAGCYIEVAFLLSVIIISIVYVQLMPNAPFSLHRQRACGRQSAIRSIVRTDL